jgi:hypothetical protein
MGRSRTTYTVRVPEEQPANTIATTRALIRARMATLRWVACDLDEPANGRGPEGHDSGLGDVPRGAWGDRSPH